MEARVIQLRTAPIPAKEAQGSCPSQEILRKGWILKINDTREANGWRCAEGSGGPRSAAR